MYTKLILLAVLTALVLSLFLAPGCDKLTTQINNNTYYDSTLGNACLTCHGDNTNVISVPKGQWANSAHASSSLIYAYASFGDTTHYLTAQCGPICHTSQGFQQYALTKSSGAQLLPSVIDCFTCHLPHTGPYGSWRLDTLRGYFSQGVDLNDLSQYSMGKSNQCAVCHQVAQYADLSGAATSVLSDSLGPDGPHSGSDAQLMMGVSGYLFGQALDTTHSHLSVASKGGCLACHYGVLPLGTAQGNDFGGHSFKLLDTITRQQYTANCNVALCHSVSPPAVVDFFTSTKLDSIRVLKDSLAGRLIALNILRGSGDSSHFYKDSTLPLYAARILYNYLLVKQDRSRGIHNPGYSLQLLEASLANIDSIPRASFYVSDTTPCTQQTITFTNTSNTAGKGNYTDTWDYGDGSTPGPINTHAYPRPDSFLVILTVSGPAGSATAHMYVFVDSVPRAGFTAAESPSDTTHSTWLFADTSSNKPTSWLWNFGDSTTDTTQNPSHTYAAPRLTNDTVLVRLTAANRCGQNTDSLKIVILPTPAPALIGSRRR